MLKKVQLFILGLAAASCLMAQPVSKSVNINESDIQFWVGNGNNSSVIAIGWDDEDASYTPTVVVWGIHWSGTITLLDALDTLMTYDSRFTYTISGSFLSGLNYNDVTNGIHLSPSAGWNCNNYNGVYGSTNLSATWLRISESTCSNYNFTGVNNLIYASDPNSSSDTDPVDASLPFSDILYWVGSGSDSAEFIVSFAQPDTALAWGFLFNGSTTAQSMIDAIAAADPRFWTTGTPSYNGDIHFVTDNGDTLGLSPVIPTVGYNFWWTNLNGVSAGSGAASTLHNGDVFKYGDLNSATGWDPMGTYFMEEAWTTTPTPVPAPTSVDTPEDASFAATDILYWVGTGSNEVVLAVNWADTALAWGYRFNGEKTVADMMSEIAAADPRFSFTTSGSMLTDINFNTGSSTLGIAAGNYWWSLLNHESGMGMIDDLEDGDFYKWGDLSVAVIADSTWVPDWGGYWDYTYVWPYTIYPVSVPTITPDVPEDASFAATDILYWVGTGSNEVVLAVNWADTALAWGYRFNGERSVADMMSDIAAADPRFSFTTSGSMLSDINFNTGSSTLGIAAGNYWWSLLNHESGMGMIDDLEDGDFFKWGDLSVAVIADSTWVEDWGGYWDYAYVWPMTIHPVSVPAPVVPVPDEATIDASAIEYWVGEGSNQVVMAVNWADTALAWGYRFDGDKTVADMMSDIAADDPRFSYTMNGGLLSDINFTAGSRTLAITPGNWWSSTNNGIMDMGMGQTINNGDFEKWADPAAGVIVDSTYDEQYSYWWYTYVYPMTIYPVSVPAPVVPVPDEATIDASAIEYWVGTGSNEAILAVNWADTALAWGYRFNGDKTVADMMSDIAAADHRFSYTTNDGLLSDINFTAGSRTLAITPGSYWGSTNNGIMDMGMAQPLANGDLEKWADPAAGVIVDSTYDSQWQYWWYTYVYPMTINPVSQPEGMGPFCGIAGTEGCTAVKYDDSRIKAWATACTIVRGSQNLTNPDAPEVTYGDEEEAIGPVTGNNMNVVSLGDGGYATLTFEKPIANGNGYDFAVFENSFDDYFLELAFVEVSSDGQRFVRFPATSLTQTARQIGGSGHVDATYINNLAGKYKVGFGTPFDLDELRDSTAVDINSITHVRIIDVVGSIDPQYATYDAFGHIVNDPFPTVSYSAGFDLDGIAVMNQKSEAIDGVANLDVAIFPNPVADMMNINASEEMTAQLFDMSGRCLMTITLHYGNNNVSMDGIGNGVYLLRTPAGVQKIVKR